VTTPIFTAGDDSCAAFVLVEFLCFLSTSQLYVCFQVNQRRFLKNICFSLFLAVIVSILHKQRFFEQNPTLSNTKMTQSYNECTQLKIIKFVVLTEYDNICTNISQVLFSLVEDDSKCQPGTNSETNMPSYSSMCCQCIWLDELRRTSNSTAEI
jgi:hypothetical protein